MWFRLPHSDLLRRAEETFARAYKTTFVHFITTSLHPRLVAIQVVPPTVRKQSTRAAFRNRTVAFVMQQPNAIENRQLVTQLFQVRSLLNAPTPNSCDKNTSTAPRRRGKSHSA